MVRGNQRAAKCGTPSGYNRHCQRGDIKKWKTGELKRCDLCSEAHAEYQAKRIARRKELAATCTIKGAGTRSGYMRHWRDGDVKEWKAGTMDRCLPCTEGNRLHSQKYYGKNKQYAKERKDYNILYGRVLRRLAKLHPIDFERLMTEERRRLRREENGRKESAGRK